MTYVHAQVSEITTPPDRYIGPEKLREFCEELTGQVRGLKTMTRDDRSQWVYFDGELMVRGWVGYGDFQSSREGDKKFVVCARHISNGKYNDHNEQHYMKMSVNMSVALRVAKAHLTKYTTPEIERTFRKTIRDLVHNKRSVIVNKISRLINNLGLSAYNSAKDRVFAELRHLVKAGHNFSDPTFGADVVHLLEEQRLLSSLGDTIPMDFIHIYPTPWETRADILHISDARSHYSAHTQNETQTWVADELPESIMGKVAVMQMCADKQYVEDVGYRINEHTFYFHSESPDTWK